MADADMGVIMIHVKNHMRACMAEGLSGTLLKPSHVPVLVTVSSNPGRSITDLSEMTGLDKSTVARTVQQLVELEMVDREGNPRQMNRVYLTDAGEKAAKDVKAMEARAWDDLLSELSKDEIHSLSTILGKIMSRLKEGSSNDGNRTRY